MFENHSKSLILEHYNVLDKTVACGQTVLPDRSIANWTNVDGKCHETFVVILKHCVAGGKRYRGKSSQ